MRHYNIIFKCKAEGKRRTMKFNRKNIKVKLMNFMIKYEAECKRRKMKFTRNNTWVNK